MYILMYIYMRNRAASARGATRNTSDATHRCVISMYTHKYVYTYMYAYFIS